MSRSADQQAVRETAEEGILIAFVEYACRVCTATSEIGVLVKVTDEGEPYVAPDHLHVTECLDCGCERTHVFTNENTR